MDVEIKGEGIDIDLEQLTISEYRKFAQGSMLDSEDDALLAKVTGKTVEWVQGLSQPAYRRLLAAFFRKAREPLADPN